MDDGGYLDCGDDEAPVMRPRGIGDACLTIRPPVAERQGRLAAPINGRRVVRMHGVINVPQTPPCDTSSSVGAASRSGSPGSNDLTDLSAEAVIITDVDLEVLCKVGEGQTAEVFRGHWKGEVVAIKQLFQRRRGLDHKELITISREVAVMSRVKHDHLVKLIGFSPVHPLKVVTEFCEGGSIFDLLHNSDHIDIVTHQNNKMCWDVAVAMDYLHKQRPQIVHRDLKSHNLLLTNCIRSSDDVPHVKIADFGLARIALTDKEGDWGKMTHLAGSRQWMAPEVVLGTTYDEKVDIYSYAIVLYEVLTRSMPFGDFTGAEIKRQLAQGMRPEIECLPMETPAVLRSLMTACWVQAPVERPPFWRVVKTIKDADLQLGPVPHLE